MLVDNGTCLNQKEFRWINNKGVNNRVHQNSNFETNIFTKNDQPVGGPRLFHNQLSKKFTQQAIRSTGNFDFFQNLRLHLILPFLNVSEWNSTGYRNPLRNLDWSFFFQILYEMGITWSHRQHFTWVSLIFIVNVL